MSWTLISQSILLKQLQLRLIFYFYFQLLSSKTTDISKKTFWNQKTLRYWELAIENSINQNSVKGCVLPFIALSQNRAQSDTYQNVMPSTVTLLKKSHTYVLHSVSCKGDKSNWTELQVKVNKASLNDNPVIPPMPQIKRGNLGIIFIVSAKKYVLTPKQNHLT